MVVRVTESYAVKKYRKPLPGKGKEFIKKTDQIKMDFKTLLENKLKKK